MMTKVEQPPRSPCWGHIHPRSGGAQARRATAQQRLAAQAELCKADSMAVMLWHD